MNFAKCGLMVGLALTTQFAKASILCKSVNSTSLLPDASATMSFEIDTKLNLRKVTLVDAELNKIDAVADQSYTQPPRGYEDEPLVLMPWENPAIKDGQEYVGRYRAGGFLSRYYNEWIFINRQLLEGTRQEGYVHISISDSAEGSLGTVDRLLLSCVRK